MGWLEIIGQGLKAFNNLSDLFGRAVVAYETQVKINWAESLQAGLQPLEQGGPTTDEQKLAAAKAVAEAISRMK